MTEQTPSYPTSSDSLGVPGMDLNYEYPVSTEEEMCELWEQYDPSGTATSCTEVFGVYSRPSQPIRAVASVDLCEVVRETRLSSFRISGLEVEEGGFGLSDVNYEYAYNAETWYRQELVGAELGRSIVTTIARVLLSRGLVQPVAHIDAIAAILRNWRKQGVYCVANTSTLPGCEAGTITHTLGATLPGCFDGLVLPRNHDGKGKITKAMALAGLAKEAGVPLAEVPLVHIDDAAPHIASFKQHYANKQDIKLLSPVHYLKPVTDPDLQCETSFEAFVRANNYFKQAGVTKV